MDAESVRNMLSDLAATNKQYCQSCILLVLYIIYSYDARKLKHKVQRNSAVEQCALSSYTGSVCSIHLLHICMMCFFLSLSPNVFTGSSLGYLRHSHKEFQSVNVKRFFTKMKKNSEEWRRSDLILTDLVYKSLPETNCPVW